MKMIIQWNCQALSGISYLGKGLSFSEAESVTDC